MLEISLERNNSNKPMYMKHLFIDSLGFYNNCCIDSEDFSKHCISKSNCFGFRVVEKILSHDNNLELSL